MDPSTVNRLQLRVEWLDELLVLAAEVFVKYLVQIDGQFPNSGLWEVI